MRDDRVQRGVRLQGIEAPEIGQDFGRQAKQAASNLSFAKTVPIWPIVIDRCG